MSRLRAASKQRYGGENTKNLVKGSLVHKEPGREIVSPVVHILYSVQRHDVLFVHATSIKVSFCHATKDLLTTNRLVSRATEIRMASSNNYGGQANSIMSDLKEELDAAIALMSMSPSESSSSTRRSVTADEAEAAMGMVKLRTQTHKKRDKGETKPLGLRPKVVDKKRS